jgi:periplasmic divalent cation tolerance protein
LKFCALSAKIEPVSDHGSSKEIVCFITAPNEDEAVNIARALVESRLAACANIINSVRSIYSWQGAIEDDAEVLMIVKTRKDLFHKLSEKVKEIHSYDVPEVIAVPIIDGLKDYLNWLRESTST